MQHKKNGFILLFIEHELSDGLIVRYWPTSITQRENERRFMNWREISSSRYSTNTYSEDGNLLKIFNFSILIIMDATNNFPKRALNWLFPMMMCYHWGTHSPLPNIKHPRVDSHAELWNMSSIVWVYDDLKLLLRSALESHAKSQINW